MNTSTDDVKIPKLTPVKVESFWGMVMRKLGNIGWLMLSAYAVTFACAISVAGLLAPTWFGVSFIPGSSMSYVYSAAMLAAIAVGIHKLYTWD